MAPVELLVEDVVLCVFAFDFFAFFLVLCVVPVDVVSLDFIPAGAVAEELLGGASVLFTVDEPVAPVDVVALVPAAGAGAVDAPVVCAFAVAARQR